MSRADFTIVFPKKGVDTKILVQRVDQGRYAPAAAQRRLTVTGPDGLSLPNFMKSLAIWLVVLTVELLATSQSIQYEPYGTQVQLNTMQISQQWKRTPRAHLTHDRAGGSHMYMP